MADYLKARYRISFTPEYQLDWDLKYAVVPNRTTLHFEHCPRAPGHDVLSSHIARLQFPNLNNTYVHHPQGHVAKGPRTPEPVIVSHSTGSHMAPARGFDPNIAFQPTVF